MYELLLVGVEHFSSQKKYLYAIELSKRKILKIVKYSGVAGLCSSWKKGQITAVDEIKQYVQENNTYETKGDRIIGEYEALERTLLNTSSYPDNYVRKTHSGNYGIIRLNNLIRVSESGREVTTNIWGWNEEEIILGVSSPTWISFWEKGNQENTDKCVDFFASQSRKVFALVMSDTTYPMIIDFIAM